MSWKWIEQHLRIDAATQEKALATLVLLLIVMLGRLITLRIAHRYIRDLTGEYDWKKNTLYVAGLLVTVGIARIWWSGFQSIFTFLGLLSAGLAIALKDLIANMAGWLFIITKRPFHVGDRIQIGKLMGDIIDIRLFQFSLMEIGNWVHSDQSTGRIVHVPNGIVFREYQANYTQGFPYIWNEIPVLLTFESDWKRAKSILLNIAETRVQYDLVELKRTMHASRNPYVSA